MRKKGKRLVFLSVGFLFFFILVSVKKNISTSLYQTISSLVCDEERGKAVIHELCQSYSQGQVAGNLCVDLCKTGQLNIEQCLSHKNDNVIFSAKWRQKSVILKAKRMSSHNTWEEVFPDSSSQDIADLQRNFLAVVYDHVISQLIHFKNLKNNTFKLSPDTLLAKLYFDASASSLTRNEMRSLWMLLQQDEYFLMQLLKDFKHIPRVLGTCGQFYTLEKVKTLNEFVGLRLISTPITWSVRVKLALQVLDLVEELDSKTMFGFGWQHCDIQPSNFGINNAGVIKTIDVDLMYTNAKILEILSQQFGNCSSHKDCEFFDCASLCDLRTKKCTSIRISNNLLVICRDLFKSKWYEDGLLTGIPSTQGEKKLNKILDECATETTVQWTKRKYNRILETLKRYLSRELIYEQRRRS